MLQLWGHNTTGVCNNSDHELMVKFTLHHTPVLNRTETIDMLKDKNPILGHMDVLCYADVPA